MSEVLTPAEVENRITELCDRLEALSEETSEAMHDEAEATADYEELYHQAYIVADIKGVSARENAARAAAMLATRKRLITGARVKALRAEQAALESRLSAYQTLYRGVTKIGA
jgi:hypothetical protein